MYIKCTHNTSYRSQSYIVNLELNICAQKLSNCNIYLTKTINQQCKYQLVQKDVIINTDKDIMLHCILCDIRKLGQLRLATLMLDYT